MELEIPSYSTNWRSLLTSIPCVDGVAPRAKMNQQRARRFRAAQEAKENDQKKEDLHKMLAQQHVTKTGEQLIREEVVQKTWDSNVITPGTPFMDILAASLRYWIAYKLNTDPGWENVCFDILYWYR